MEQIFKTKTDSLGRIQLDKTLATFFSIKECSRLDIQLHREDKYLILRNPYNPYTHHYSGYDRLIDSRLQIVLPRDYRNILSIKDDMELYLCAYEGGIRVSKEPPEIPAEHCSRCVSSADLMQVDNKKLCLACFLAEFEPILHAYRVQKFRQLHEGENLTEEVEWLEALIEERNGVLAAVGRTELICNLRLSKDL